MHPVHSEDIMLSQRISKVIHRYHSIYAGLKEIQTVLLHHCIIYGTLTYQQFALQITGLPDQRSGLIPLRICLRTVQISRPLHHFIPFPVYYRAACHPHLENIRIGGHKRNGHKPAVAPSVHPDS